jgi:hypothetical protein
LFDFLHARGMTRSPLDSTERLAPQVAVTCENPSLASATIVRIPDAGYPRLKPDASPYLVRADGSYQLLHGGDLHVAGAVADYHTRGVRLQLSHWSHVLALPLMTRVAQSPAASKAR